MEGSSPIDPVSAGRRNRVMRQSKDRLVMIVTRLAVVAVAVVAFASRGGMRW